MVENHMATLQVRPNKLMRIHWRKCLNSDKMCKETYIPCTAMWLWKALIYQQFLQDPCTLHIGLSWLPRRLFIFEQLNLAHYQTYRYMTQAQFKIQTSIRIPKINKRSWRTGCSMDFSAGKNCSVRGRAVLVLQRFAPRIRGPFLEI